MPNQRILPQDFSTSPSFHHSQSTIQNASIPPSTRRNLFASHLSRRPVPTESRSQSSQMTDPFQIPSPTRSNSHSDVFRTQPTLQPTQRGMNVQDVYNSPSSSPTRTTSPGNQFFPSSSIVAVNPQTGRPILPSMPVLPPRLRLSDGNEDDEDIEPTMDSHHHHRSPGTTFMRTSSSNFASDRHRDLDYDSSLLLSSMRPQEHDLRCFLDTNAMTDARDLERIERLLRQMQEQQRLKAQSASIQSDTNSGLDTGDSGMHASSRISTRSRGKGRSTVTTRNDFASSGSGSNVSTAAATASQPRLGGVGACMDPTDKEEILGLITTSLRRKVAEAEDESWQYTGIAAEGGVDGLGMGLGNDVGYYGGEHGFE